MLNSSWFDLVQVLFRQPQLLGVHECSGPFLCRRYSFFLVLPQMWILQFFWFPLYHSAWALRRGFYRCPICDWTFYWLVTLFSALWRVLRVCVNHHSLKLLFRCLRLTLHTYRNMNIEDSVKLTLEMFSKVKLKSTILLYIHKCVPMYIHWAIYTYNKLYTMICIVSMYILSYIYI